MSGKIPVTLESPPPSDPAKEVNAVIRNMREAKEAMIGVAMEQGGSGGPDWAESFMPMLEVAAEIGPPMLSGIMVYNTNAMGHRSGVHGEPELPAAYKDDWSIVLMTPFEHPPVYPKGDSLEYRWQEIRAHGCDDPANPDEDLLIATRLSWSTPNGVKLGDAPIEYGEEAFFRWTAHQMARPCRRGEAVRMAGAEDWAQSTGWHLLYHRKRPLCRFTKFALRGVWAATAIEIACFSDVEP